MLFALVCDCRFLGYVLGRLLAMFAGKSWEQIALFMAAAIAQCDFMIQVPWFSRLDFAPAEVTMTTLPVEYPQAHTRWHLGVICFSNPFFC